MVLIAFASIYLLVRVALRRPKQSSPPIPRPNDPEHAHSVSHTMRGDISEVSRAGGDLTASETEM